MNKIHQAFIDGFIKAAAGLPTSVATPTVATPTVATPTVATPTSLSNVNNVSRVSSPVSPLRIANTAINTDSIAKNQYSVDIGGWNQHFTDKPNTLNISAHGGPNPAELDASGHNPYSFFNELIHSNAAAGANTTEYPPFSLKDIASGLGRHTNDIHNLNSFACNFGEPVQKSFLGYSHTPNFSKPPNPNEVSSGFATPAYYKQYFPNLTNVVQVPPGYVGFGAPKGASPITDNKLMDFITEKIRKSYSRQHQYNLENGTNWVDKGVY